jgi:hypothetical protein
MGMKVCLFFIVLCFIVDSCIYTHEPKKRIIFTTPELLALHRILQELTSESTVDDDDDVAEEPSIFEQLTLFIDSRLRNTLFPYTFKNGTNALSPDHLIFMTHFLEKNISSGHEAFHLVQQGYGKKCKNSMRITIQKLYNTIKGCPPELLHQLKIT